MENRLFCAKMTGQGGTAARGAEKKGSFFLVIYFVSALLFFRLKKMFLSLTFLVLLGVISILGDGIRKMTKKKERFF